MSKLTEILTQVFRAGVGSQADDIKGNETAYYNLQKSAVEEAEAAILAWHFELLDKKLAETKKKHQRYCKRWIDEVIGEDEEVEYFDKPWKYTEQEMNQDYERGYNDAKDEIRKRAGLK